MDTMRRPWLPALFLLCVFGADAPAAETLVSLEHVQANPSDKRLAYSFALKQVRAGELEQASIALRQVLRIDPDWDAARLFYATVLFRLDELDRARNEFNTLAARPLTEVQQDEVARYLALIEHRTGQTTHTAAFAASPPAPTAMASILSLSAGGDDPTDTATEPNRIDLAFSAWDHTRPKSAAVGSHPSLLFLGLAGDGMAPLGSVPDAYAPVARTEWLSFGRVQISTEVLSEAFGSGVLPVIQSGGSLEARYDLSPSITLGLGASTLRQELDTPYGEIDGPEMLQMSAVGVSVETQSWMGAQFSGSMALVEGNDPNAGESYQGVRFYGSGRQPLGMGQFLLGEVWYLNLSDSSEGGHSTASGPEDQAGVRFAYGLPVSTASEVLNLPMLPLVGDANLYFAGSYSFDNAGPEKPGRGGAAQEVLLKKNVAF